MSSTLIENDITLTKPKDFANAFKKYFINISSSKFFFIKPVDKIEIKNIISSLNRLKTVGPNSIPTKILKLLSNNMSNQLSELLNLSFSLGVFP